MVDELPAVTILGKASGKSVCELGAPTKTAEQLEVYLVYIKQRYTYG